LLARSRAPAKLIGDLVHRRSQLSSDVTSAFLGAAARNGAIDVFSLASHGGSALLDVLSGDGLATFLGQPSTPTESLEHSFFSSPYALAQVAYFG